MAISYVGTGAKASATGSTSASVAISGAALAGDGLFLWVSLKRASVASVNTPSGWTLIGNAVVGTGSDGSDAGQIELYCFFAEESGSTPNPSVALSGSVNTTNDGWQAWVVAFRKDVSETWDIAEIGSGSDTSSGTAFSVTSTTGHDLLADDWVQCIAAVSNDAATMSSRNITATNTTLGTYSSRTGAATTNGNDHYSAIQDKPVASGGSNCVITYSATLGTSTTGGALFIRIRAAVAGPAAQTCSPTAIASEEAFGTPSIPGTPISVSDDFNRTGPALGSNWITAGPNPPTISSNRVVASTTGVSHGVRWVTSCGTDDMFSQGTYQGQTEYSGVTVAMPAFTSSDSSAVGTWYVFRQQALTGGCALLQKNLDAGTYTILDTGTGWSNGDIVRLEYEAGVLRGYVNGTQRVTHTPSSPISGQRYVGFGESLAGNSGLPMLDNWSGGDLVGPAVTVSPTEIATAEAFGTPTRTSIITSSPTGIATAQAFGTPTRTSFITSSPTGIATAEIFGNLTVTVSNIQAITLSPTGIASAEAFGTPVRTSFVTLLPTGIASAEAFGTPVRTSAITSLPTGIASAQVFGVPVISSSVTVLPTGITSAEIFGTPVRTSSLTAIATGIASAETFGTPTRTSSLTALAAAIASAEAFGIPVISSGLVISPTGIASAQVFSTPVISGTLVVNPGSIGSGEAFGSPLSTSGIILLPQAIISAQALGSPTIAAIVALGPTGIPTAETVPGPVVLTPTVVLPAAIGTAETFGTPYLSEDNLITPLSIPSEEVFGDVAAYFTQQVNLIGIPSQETFGLVIVDSPVTLYPAGIITGEMIGTLTVTTQVILLPWSILTEELVSTPYATGAGVGTPAYQGWGIPIG